MRQRFDNETYVTSRLQHPGVVAVFDRASTEDGSLCYMMSLAQGKTLSQYLEDIRGSEFPWQMVSLVDRINLFIKILDVMAYAHSMGVVHRDLKPDNIIIGEHGEVRILDWGLARSLREVEGSMDPEYLYDQVFGEETRSNHQRPRTTSRFRNRTSDKHQRTDRVGSETGSQSPLTTIDDTIINTALQAQDMAEKVATQSELPPDTHRLDDAISATVVQHLADTGKITHARRSL